MTKEKYLYHQEIAKVAIIDELKKFWIAVGSDLSW